MIYLFILAFIIHLIISEPNPMALGLAAAIGFIIVAGGKRKIG